MLRISSFNVSYFPHEFQHFHLYNPLFIQSFILPLIHCATTRYTPVTSNVITDDAHIYSVR